MNPDGAAGPTKEGVPPAADGRDPPGGSLVGSAVAYGRRRIAWARETAERDAEALSTLPAGPWSAYGLVGAVLLVFSVLRLGIADLYTESLPFLLLAVVVGMLGWSLGVLLVLAHASIDLLHSIGDLTPKTFVGRLVTYVVLYALVVSVPSTQRALHARLDRVDEQYPWLDEVAAPASAVGAGALVYLWAEVAPYLVRTAFEFGPTVVAIATVQDNAVLLSAWAAAVALAVALWYQRRVGAAVTLPWAGEAMLVPGRFVWLRRGLRYGVVVVLVSGIITTALDVVILAAALVAVDLLLPETARLGPVRDLLLSIPYTLRLVLAFGLTFFAARFLMAIRYGPVAGSQFFPLVLSLAVGLFVFRLLLNVDEAVDETIDGSVEEPRDRWPPVGVVALLVVLLALATAPDVALAHDCSSLADCENGARAGTAAGVSALALALWYWTSGGSATADLGGRSPPGGADADVAATEPGAGGDETEPADDDRGGSARLPGAVGAGEAGVEEAGEDEEDGDDAGGELEIVDVVTDPDAAAEYVVLRNAGDGYLDLSGWTVDDGAGDEYVFPDGAGIEPGNRLRLYTGSGVDTESVHHWGRGAPVWGDPGGRVTARNAVGDVADAGDVGSAGEGEPDEDGPVDVDGAEGDEE